MSINTVLEMREFTSILYSTRCSVLLCGESMKVRTLAILKKDDAQDSLHMHARKL
jgi:hypothetical protein